MQHLPEWTAGSSLELIKCTQYGTVLQTPTSFCLKTYTSVCVNTYAYVHVVGAVASAILDTRLIKYSKTCQKRNAIVPVFFSVFTGFRFTKGCVLIKKYKKYHRLGLQ